MPTVIFVTSVVGKNGFVIVTVPLKTDHDPLPTAGMFAAKVAVFRQVILLLPAKATEGGSSL